MGEPLIGDEHNLAALSTFGDAEAMLNIRFRRRRNVKRRIMALKMARANSRVLVVGVGGIGSPLALILARAGVGTLGLVDDDLVEGTNLHRQILFAESDIGRDKLDAAASGLARILELNDVGVPTLELHRMRFRPENALELAGQYDLVVEGADNFSTKFLAADAARLARRPIVHAAAVRTTGTVLSVSAEAAPCYRCLFEDMPREGAPNCADAGVIGPLLGLVAAYQADLALSVLDGTPRVGELVSIDVAGLKPKIRAHSMRARPGCSLCGDGARAAFGETLDPARYVPPPCATS